MFIIDYTADTFDITDKLKLLDASVKHLVLRTTSDTAVNFTYFPDTVDTLSLVNAYLSIDAIKTLKASRLSNYQFYDSRAIRGSSDGAFERFKPIVLPETTVRIESITINPQCVNGIIDSLKIPYCDYLRIRGAIVTLTGCKLGTTTSIDSDRVIMTNCTGAVKLEVTSFKYHSTCVVLGMPGLLNVKAYGVDLVLYGCDGVKKLKLQEGSVITTDILKLSSLSLVNSRYNTRYYTKYSEGGKEKMVE